MNMKTRALMVALSMSSLMIAQEKDTIRVNLGEKEIIIITVDKENIKLDTVDAAPSEDEKTEINGHSKFVRAN